MTHNFEQMTNLSDFYNDYKHFWITNRHKQTESHLEGERKYYIDQAGGLNTRARKRAIKVIKGGTEIWLRPYEAKKIEPGDAIWVPEKEDRDRFEYTRDILIIAGNAAAVIATIFSIYSIVNANK